MKSNLLHRGIAIGVGAVLLFAVNAANADDPKPKHSAQTQKRLHKRSHTVAKADRSSRLPTDRDGRFPTQDGFNSTSAEGGLVGGSDGRETRVPTGSHIPQTYNRRGYNTDRADNTTIIDHNDARFLGADSPADVLRTVPGVTIRGGR